MDIIGYIIGELKAYKRNKAIYQTILLQAPSIQAQVLSDIPRSVTNKFSSSTENQALFNQDHAQLEKEIKQVEIWLGYLQEEERFVIEQFFMENRSYATISHRWSQKGYPIFSGKFWKRKSKIALSKIASICVK